MEAAAEHQMEAAATCSVPAAGREDDDMAAVVLAGRGRTFCSGADLAAAEEISRATLNDQVKLMELCLKPIVGAVARFSVTVRFEAVSPQPGCTLYTSRSHGPCGCTRWLAGGPSQSSACTAVLKAHEKWVLMA